MVKDKKKLTKRNIRKPIKKKRIMLKKTPVKKPIKKKVIKPKIAVKKSTKKKPNKLAKAKKTAVKTKSRPVAKRTVKKKLTKGLSKKPAKKKPTKKPATLKKIKPKKKEKVKPTTKKTKRVTKKVSPLTLAKSPENPVISPKAENDWEAWQTFNPGVILLDNKVHFLYRAIGEDGLSRLGYAVSSDGFNIDERLPYPIYEHQPKQHQFTVYSYFSGGSWGGCEDPRIVRVNEEGVLYMTYTACDDGLRVGLTSIKIKDFLQKRWKWKAPKLISPPGEVHKNWVIFPEKIKSKYAFLHSINPEIAIDYVDNLEFTDQKYIRSQHGGRPQKISGKCWDNWIRGAGPPPLKTKEGWLVLYHAMDDYDPGKYKVGAMILDISDPTKILHRSPEPILEPCKLYENNGFKSGVVYASGAIIKDGKLLVYYGGADTCTCVAYTNFEQFIEALKKGTKPKLKKKKLKKRKVLRKK